MENNINHYQNGHLSHLASRTYSQFNHQLSLQKLADKPELVGRILYFLIPFLFLAVSSIFLLARNLRIHQNYLIKTLPKRMYIYAILFLSLVGLAVIGIEAVISDHWRVKQWIMFASLCALFTVASFIYTMDTYASIGLSAFAILLTALGNQWFFAELINLSEATQSQIGWKHVDRNIIGFIEAVLIILFYIHLFECLKHVFKFQNKCLGISYWILAPLTIIGVLLLNILTFGPFLDSIGYIVASIILFIGSLESYFFYSDREQDQKNLI